MNNMNQDSANLLAEKLALSRELSILKPELEHLREQLTHQQATLAEKLALERQVNTLEVELANEKKATKRAMQKRESNDRVEDDLRKQLRETEKQLAAETSQRERLEDQLAQEKRTHQLALEDQDSTREAESDLRKKLQDAQKQLRDTTEEKERLEETLQTEKLQAKKAQKAAQVDSSSESDELRAKLEEAESKLSASVKKIETVRNEARSTVEEADRRSEAFEKKFEKLKTKYRELQEQLKQCQADLKQAQKAQTSMSVAEEIFKRTAGRQASKKRKGDESMSGDSFAHITIATPSADDKPQKGVKQQAPPKAAEPTAVGEKSAFSITPFLSKSLGVEEVVNQEANQDEESMMDDTFNFAHRKMSLEVRTTKVPVSGPAQTSASPEPTSTVPAESEKPKEAEEPKLQPKPRGRPKKVLGDAPTAAKKILGDAPSSKKNTQPIPKGALKKAKVAPALDKLPEESGEIVPEPAEKTQTVKFNLSASQDTSPANTSSANTSSANTSSANTSAAALPKEEPKKKKRKVLGSTKTLFDDDGEETAPARKAGQVHHGGSKKRAPLAGGVRNAFAGSSFSPLKKEKRGVAASFLA